MISLANNSPFYVFEDASHQLTINDISQLPFNEFTPTTKGSKGGTQATIWIRISLRNQTDLATDNFIYFHEPMVHSLDLFVPETNHSYLQIKAGSLIPIEQRQIQNGHNVFKVTLAPNSQQTVFAKLTPKYNSTYSYQIFESENEYQQFIHRINLYWTVFFTIDALVIIVFFLLWFVFKQSYLPLYASFVLGTSFLQLMMAGWSQSLLFVPHLELLILITVAIVFSFLIAFIQTLFETHKVTPKYHKTLNFLKWGSVVLTPILLIQPNFWVMVLFANVWITLVLLGTFISLILLKSKQTPYVNFALIGIGVLTITATYANFTLQGIIDANFYIWVFQIGSIIDLMMFTALLLTKLYQDKQTAIQTYLEKEQALLESQKLLMAQEMILTHQNRLALQGEMLQMIAHQWRQPLNQLGLLAQLNNKQLNKLESPSPLMRDTNQRILDTIQFLSNTISDFSNFFAHNKAKQTFNLHTLLTESLRVLDHRIAQLNIEIEINQPQTNIELFTHKSELAQVFIVVLNNAMDALEESAKPRLIRISAQTTEHQVKLTIEDNAGGIPNYALPYIF